MCVMLKPLTLAALVSMSASITRSRLVSRRKTCVPKRRSKPTQQSDHNVSRWLHREEVMQNDNFKLPKSASGFALSFGFGRLLRT